MAGIEFLMRIDPVDNENNLYQVQSVLSNDLVQKILQTDWLNLPWFSQLDQANLPHRRKVKNASIDWIQDWDQQLEPLYPKLETLFGVELQPYYETTWWIDEPGFNCPMHTDGELPISMQLMWIGNPGQGTVFYWYRNFDSLRYQVEFKPNSGYIMRNLPDSIGYRKLLWHAMMAPIPENSFRLTSYTVITPKNTI